MCQKPIPLRDAVSSLGGQRRRAVICAAAGSVCDTLADGIAALAPMGRLVKFGAATGSPGALPNPMQLVINNRSIMGWSSADLALLAPDRIAPIVQRALSLVADGTVPVAIDEILRLQDAAEAHRRLEAHQTTGKLLLDTRR